MSETCVDSPGLGGQMNGSEESLSLTSTPVESPRKRKASPDGRDVKRKLLDSASENLSSVRGLFAERCAIQCFLQNAGLPSEYSQWRSVLPESPLSGFLQSNRLNSTDESEDLMSVLQSSPFVTPSPLKIPIRVVEKKPKTIKPVASKDGASQVQMAERARQEAYVMQRINELQRDGLWAEKRMSKVHELPRPKAHWDYLLEEMVWLSRDFEQERKWKKTSAKKCARMVQKYFQEKEVTAQKAVKAQELQLRKIASYMAKEVKLFWSNIEKLLEFKQHVRLEAKRKKALDQHLSLIVDQTEKYSSLVAESMNVSASAVSSKQASPQHHSDIEFEPEEDSDDDEETIAKEEAMSEKNEECVNEEISALQRESNLPLDELLNDYLKQRDSLPGDDFSSPSHVSDEDSDEDKAFSASDKDSSDDEETIQEQEEQEGSVNYKAELNELNADNDLSLEDLIQKYNITDQPLPPSQTNSNNVSEVESDETDVDDGGSQDDEDKDVDGSDNDVEDEVEMEEEKEEGKKDDLQSLFKEETKETMEETNKEINDVAAIAQSLQPKGNTLSSTNVVTKVPFLLKHKLREYQHIGLDWLVTMYERNLNGILADEMGLGKTIQTISLLAHLACEKGNWGPHLIVVPTSVMLNWEMEFKKWCPAFKILTYYGSVKDRKLKRIGWTKPNAFHVCITSYKLIIQDHQSFRRKKWTYLILDEAQNIKNFKSQRWQLLLNFQTERRLLLTGTPLQNNLMELWSLMHFLMPNVFESHREFKEWFSNPVTGMIEGNSEYNEAIIKRLHKVLRPFLLRRLKSEVETQMPKKYEHVIMCRLSNRQRYLYDDFMSRAKTKETLASGNLLSVINVLMQLRKVCNHPNLFEVRPTVSPFQMEGLIFNAPALVTDALDYDPFRHVNFEYLNLNRVSLESWLLAFVAFRVMRYKASAKLIEEIDSSPPEKPPCPKGKVKISVQRRNSAATPPAANSVRPSLFHVGNNNIRNVTPGTNILPSKIPQGMTFRIASPSGQRSNFIQLVQQQGSVKAVSVGGILGVKNDGARILPGQIVSTASGKQIVVTPQQAAQVGQQVVISKDGSNVTRIVIPNPMPASMRPIVKLSPIKDPSILNAVKGLTEVSQAQQNQESSKVTPTKIVTIQSASNSPEKFPIKEVIADEMVENIRRVRRKNKLSLINIVNETRCRNFPIYGCDVISSLTLDDSFKEPMWSWTGSALCRNVKRPGRVPTWEETWGLSSSVLTLEERVDQLQDIFVRYVMYVPAVSSRRPRLDVAHQHAWKAEEERQTASAIEEISLPVSRLLHPVSAGMATQFPDPRLIQYDCGKLQALDILLRQLKVDHHRVLIFTQMTRMLDVLEAFLNHHGHIYLRLDGTTRVEQRQVLMERFNNDRRIFCFILSTRSGGVGVNLTGADTVIFYDSDWNPTMDAQAQDRCHRIGQTRDVHIYRLISEKTVEENIIKKANQKRLLGDLAIEGGNFTTAYFRSSTIQELFNVNVTENDARRRMDLETEGSNGEKKEPDDKNVSAAVLESALAQAEDESDVCAARTATAEAAAELAEFDETIPLENQDSQEPMSKAELKLHGLCQQLNQIERYAISFLERMESQWAEERTAEAAQPKRKKAPDTAEEDANVTTSEQDISNGTKAPERSTRSQGKVQLELCALENGSSKLASTPAHSTPLPSSNIVRKRRASTSHPSTSAIPAKRSKQARKSTS